MTDGVRYTPFHPKWYRRPVSVWWWLESWRYTRFVLRELTSVPVGYFCIVLLWLTAALVEGPEAYARFLASMQSPVFVLLNVLTAGAIFFHALTWFHLAPKAMVVRLGGKRVPDDLVVAANYALWGGASAAVLWLLDGA